ncbi:hypothetical protein HAX54_020130, partial [Datura stramonium]|nr:hypothetical protein [Datura stramonium]
KSSPKERGPDQWARIAVTKRAAAGLHFTSDRQGLLHPQLVRFPRDPSMISRPEQLGPRP